MVIGGMQRVRKIDAGRRDRVEIGPPPGARTLNSDRTRKAMHKLLPTDRLPPEAYARTSPPPSICGCCRGRWTR